MKNWWFKNRDDFIKIASFSSDNVFATQKTLSERLYFTQNRSDFYSISEKSFSEIL